MCTIFIQIELILILHNQSLFLRSTFWSEWNSEHSTKQITRYITENVREKWQKCLKRQTRNAYIEFKIQLIIVELQFLTWIKTMERMFEQWNEIDILKSGYWLFCFFLNDCVWVYYVCETKTAFIGMFVRDKTWSETALVIIELLDLLRYPFLPLDGVPSLPLSETLSNLSTHLSERARARR